MSEMDLTQPREQWEQLRHKPHTLATWAIDWGVPLMDEIERMKDEISWLESEIKYLKKDLGTEHPAEPERQVTVRQEPQDEVSE